MRVCLVVPVLLALAGCSSDVVPTSASPSASSASSSRPPAPSASVAPVAPVTPGPVDPARRQVELDARYRSCVLAADFDPDAVQVLLWDASLARPEEVPGFSDGAPWWVKTGHEVPARIHGPCMVAIGGTDRGLSSYGNRR